MHTQTPDRHPHGAATRIQYLLLYNSKKVLYDILLTLREFGRPNLIKPCGFGLARLCLTTRVQIICLDCSSVTFFWILACFWWRCGWYHLLLWSLWNSEQMCYWKSSPKSTKSDQGCPKGNQNRFKGVPTGGSNKRDSLGKVHANDSKMSAQI